MKNNHHIELKRNVVAFYIYLCEERWHCWLAECGGVGKDVVAFLVKWKAKDYKHDFVSCFVLFFGVLLF